ncbi:MAG TPA: hypothetical protein VHW44_28575 [Pseudonocardiaceae bacterium]|jgi:hypothetical protein|nr:hypothetical protein [Pseudonocardiaceae bacterium]
MTPKWSWLRVVVAAGVLVVLVWRLATRRLLEGARRREVYRRRRDLRLVPAPQESPVARREGGSA